MAAVLLHLLRHGAPETPGLLLGRTDSHPTPAGISACLEQSLGLEIDALVTSDLLRSRRAAEAIAAARSLSVTIDPRWRELDFGDWDGLAPTTIDPAAAVAFYADPEANPPPGGERWSQLVARVAAGIVALDAAATLVVTHGGAMRAALAHLCGLTPAQVWAFDLPYGALLTLRVWPETEPRSAQIVALRP